LKRFASLAIVEDKEFENLGLNAEKISGSGENSIKTKEEEEETRTGKTWQSARAVSSSSCCCLPG